MKIDYRYLGLYNQIKNTNIKLNGSSALFIVDMNNGFAKRGPLSSERIEALIPNICRSIEAFKDKNDRIIAFTDAHSKEDLEFEIFPEHCLCGHWESELVSEFDKYKDNIKVIEKSTTNAFMEEEVKLLIDKLIYENIKNFVICGCITEICIAQFATTLKTYINKIQKDINIIIPLNCIDTFEGPNHNADDINYYSIQIMASNGIKFVESIF